MSMAVLVLSRTVPEDPFVLQKIMAQDIYVTPCSITGSLVGALSPSLQSYMSSGTHRNIRRQGYLAFPNR